MGASRLQQAADILGVAVPFFFEGAVGGTYMPDGSAPSPAYIDDFVTSFRRPSAREGVHARTARLATPYCCARE